MAMNKMAWIATWNAVTLSTCYSIKTNNSNSKEQQRKYSIIEAAELQEADWNSNVTMVIIT